MAHESRQDRGFTTYRHDFGGQHARESLAEAGFGRGVSVLAVSTGQYSTTDWIDALLDYTGPGTRLRITTWTIAWRDLQRVFGWVDAGRCAAPVELLMDQSMPSRARHAGETSGDWRRWSALVEERARTVPRADYRLSWVHGKWSLLEAGPWRVVALVSSNMDAAPRMETMQAADDPRAFGLLGEVHERLWRAAPVGEDERLPLAKMRRALRHHHHEDLPLS